MFSTYIIYNSILILSFFFSFLYSILKKTNIFLPLCIFLTLLIPASLRYGIGTDYFSYIGILEHARNGGITTEFGYYIINFIVVYLNLNSQYIFIISGFIIYFNIILSSVMISKKYFAISILVLVCSFYLLSYSLLRQAIAISFIAVAISLYARQRFILFTVLTIVGSSFHFSVISILAFPLFSFIPIKRNFLILFTIIFSIIILNTNILTTIMSSDIFAMTKYGYYINTKFGGEAKINTGLGVLIKCIVPILVVIYSREIYSLNKNYSIIIYLSVGSILANAASTQIHIFNRLSDIFSFLSFLSVPILLMSIKNVITRYFIVFFIMGLFISLYERTIFTNLSSNNSGLGVTPYTTIFDR